MADVQDALLPPPAVVADTSWHFLRLLRERLQRQPRLRPSSLLRETLAEGFGTYGACHEQLLAVHPALPPPSHLLNSLSPLAR